MSRKIEDLQGWFQVKVNAFKLRCQETGLPILITRTLVDDATQEALWTINRDTLTTAQEQLLKNQGLYPNDLTKTRTNARYAKDSAHGWGLGFDYVPLNGLGQPWFDAPADIWMRTYVIARECGLDCLGDVKMVGIGEYLPSDKGHAEEWGWRIYKNGNVPGR